MASPCSLPCRADGEGRKKAKPPRLRLYFPLLAQQLGAHGLAIPCLPLLVVLGLLQIKSSPVLFTEHLLWPSHVKATMGGTEGARVVLPVRHEDSGGSGKGPRSQGAWWKESPRKLWSLT